MDNVYSNAEPPTVSSLINLFNDLVFSCESESDLEFDGAEELFYDRVCERLDDNDALSKYIPSPPDQLIMLLEELKQENTDFDKIKQIIMNDPNLLGEIIRISNSPLYRPRSGEITSIEKAISMLGLQGVMQIASQLMLRRIVDIKSPRFKKFGSVLWAHCMKSAEGCRTVGEVDDAFRNYLLGLIHDIGKVAILGCVVDFAKVNADDTVDEVKVLRRVSIEQGAWMSTLIAKEWEMPEVYLDTLEEYDALTTNLMCGIESEIKLPGTQILQWGNLSSQVHSFINRQMLDAEAGVEFLQSLGLTLPQLETLFKKYSEIEDSGS